MMMQASKIRRLSTLVALTTLLTLILAVPSSQAASKRIWMDKFKPGISHMSDSGTVYTYLYPGEVSTETLGDHERDWFGYAVVRLPTGAELSKVGFWVYNFTGANSPTVQFYRQQFGTRAVLLASKTLAGAVDDSAKFFLDWEPGADKIVRGNYRYFVRVIVPSGVSIRGVIVNYREPAP
jgi:hypothetical protein